MQSLRIEGAVPGSYIEVVPSGSADWHLRVCEGIDPDNMKEGAQAEFKLPVGVKLYGPGKTSNNAELGTELMRTLADFYHKHKK